MEKHFTIYKHHNYHHYYNNLLYHQRFVSNSNINFMTLNQLEKKVDGRLFFVHIDIDL
jgi:hypothetical protein